MKFIKENVQKIKDPKYVNYISSKFDGEGHQKIVAYTNDNQIIDLTEYNPIEDVTNLKAELEKHFSKKYMKHFMAPFVGSSMINVESFINWTYRDQPFGRVEILATFREGEPIVMFKVSSKQATALKNKLERLADLINDYRIALKIREITIET